MIKNSQVWQIMYKHFIDFFIFSLSFLKMIKILTEDIQKEMHVNEKEILNKNHKKGSKTDRKYFN